MHPTSIRAPAGALRQQTRTLRQQHAREIAEEHGGVAHRRQLAAAGIHRDVVRAELAAGRWHRAGVHTVVIDGVQPSGIGLSWRAVWESGSGAVLDGVAALLAKGLTEFRTTRIDISLPRSTHARCVDGVTLHRPRELVRAPGVGIPRVPLELAAIHAAQWAASDRQAALVLCLPVQQRLIPADRLLHTWLTISRSRRRALIHRTILDIADGAQALSELDFARWCRRYGLPEPSRQVLRHGPHGKAYLDAYWENGGLVVGIDGSHHLVGLNPVLDALRSNELVLGHDRVLRLPLRGLRLDPDAFMAQVCRAVLGS